ncbi:hypothetical protein [Stenotrophomonas sp. PS02298]|uniref:hypothetical protein n=1 Tax=Stenotrophomonas sp. PS02298 TaxID=2991424 RepID=UPI00249BFFB1|nr:hypothetical protein [Stenotrophomonas sp. PS02298]
MSAPLLQPCDIRGTTNRSAGIRAVLRASGPMTTNEICLAMGITDSYTRAAVRSTMRAMKQDGIVSRSEGAHPPRWSILREPQERNYRAVVRPRAQAWAEKQATAYKNAEAAYLKWRDDTAADKRSIGERVRQIVKQLGEASADEIYTALGLTPEVGRVRMYSIIHNQARDGMLERIQGRPLRYRWLRDPKPTNAPRHLPRGDNAKRTADRLQRHAERQAQQEQRAEARRLAREQRIAQQKREHDARLAARQRAALERAALRAQKQSTQIARLAAATARLAGEPTPQKQTPTIQTETIEQWMARTGKQPEVLPHNFDDPITSFPGRRPTINPKGHTT